MLERSDIEITESDRTAARAVQSKENETSSSILHKSPFFKARDITISKGRKKQGLRTVPALTLQDPTGTCKLFEIRWALGEHLTQVLGNSFGEARAWTPVRSEHLLSLDCREVVARK